MIIVAMGHNKICKWSKTFSDNVTWILCYFVILPFISLVFANFVDANLVIIINIKQ